MIKRLLAATIFCACMCVPHMQAQSIETAATTYQEFTKLRAAGTDKSAMYDALYKSYLQYVAVLNVAALNSPEYIQAKNALREMHPYLRGGAIHFSSNNQASKALLLCQAFIDLPMMPAFSAEKFVQDSYYPTMAYFAASNTYLSGDYARAAGYFRVYITTGEEKHRHEAYNFMIDSYMKVGNHNKAMESINEASNNYPNDFNLLSMAINSCYERGDNENLQKFVTKAMALQPNNETLLNIQGMLYEETNEFQKALNIYNKLLEMNPNSLSVTQHLALNYYNLGVFNYNKATMAEDEMTAKKFSRQSDEYFSAASTMLETIVANDPTSIKYLQALAVTYSCVGDNANLEAVNSKLMAMGGGYIAADVIPSMMTYSDNTVTSNSATASGTLGGDDAFAQTFDSSEIPDFTTFAQEYINPRVIEWQTKDPYETIEEYQDRVTETTRNEKIEALKKEAEKEYIETYANHVRLNDFYLKPYDSEHEVFLVQSQYGDLIVPVPRSNREAQTFESSWNGMQFKNPEFHINNGKLELAKLTFVTPYGNSYTYDNSMNREYVDVVVDVDGFGSIEGLYAGNTGGKSRVTKSKVSMGKSDVDKNIPEAKMPNEKTYAVVISNENYGMVSHVPMALSDGEAFSQYCIKTLGLPKDNVRHYKDASFGVMLRAIRETRDIAKARHGDLKVIFYYAGHGIPNEQTKDAYLLPIDADGLTTEGCYSLNRLYRELGELNAESVLVFLDACFSGASRDGDGSMLAEARGVALKAKPETPKGNMVVFSAASGEETAFPYREKSHGLFTYFLLKKLQETKGDVNLKDLFNYISDNVQLQSVQVNHKMQTPSVIPSESVAGIWQDMKMIVEPPVVIDPVTGQPAPLDENGNPIFVDPNNPNQPLAPGQQPAEIKK